MLLLRLYYNVELCKFKNWNQPFILSSDFNCKTPNLIHVIICSGFDKEYNKPEDSLKRDSIFTNNTCDNLNMKSRSRKTFTDTCKGNIFLKNERK